MYQYIILTAGPRCCVVASLIPDDGTRTRTRALARAATRLRQLAILPALHAQGVVPGAVEVAAASDYGPCFTFADAAPGPSVGGGSGVFDKVRADGFGVDVVESTARHFSANASGVDTVKHAAWGVCARLVLAAGGISAVQSGALQYGVGRFPKGEAAAGHVPPEQTWARVESRYWLNRRTS